MNSKRLSLDRTVTTLLSVQAQTKQSSVRDLSLHTDCLAWTTECRLTHDPLSPHAEFELQSSVDCRPISEFTAVLQYNNRQDPSHVGFRRHTAVRIVRVWEALKVIKCAQTLFYGLSDRYILVSRHGYPIYFGYSASYYYCHRQIDTLNQIY